MCTPCFWGFFTVNLISRMQCTLIQLYRFGYTAQLIFFNDVVKSWSVDLFHNMRKSNHCLHELLSSYSQRSDSLRARRHDFVLPVCPSNLHKQSSIVTKRRYLYDFILLSQKLLFFNHLFMFYEFLVLCVRLSHFLMKYCVVSVGYCITVLVRRLLCWL